MMRGLVLVLSLYALVATVTKVTCMTNEEFFNWSKDFATDIEVSDIEENAIDDVDSDDVITLRGNPDDEVDFDYILMKLGMNDAANADALGGTSCSCQHYSCNCCLQHTFKVNLWLHKIKFNLHACLQVAYLRNNIGVQLTFTINGHRLYHREISLKHPPGLCFNVPGLGRLARVCVELYNINLASKHICARITGVIDLKFKKFKVHLNLGCFTIPMLDKDAFQLMLNSPDFLKIKPLEDAAPSRDLATLFFQRHQKSQID